jgi:hypothetical protein
MRHLLQILLEELENEILKTVYTAQIDERHKHYIAQGIKLDIKRFHESRRVPEYKKERAFVRHIENHLSNMDVGNDVICKICNKTIDQIDNETDEFDII